MKNTATKQVALGGILAALAISMMSLGSLIPLSTYVCPMLCAVICQIVTRFYGKRTAWIWYLAVSMLCFFLCADQEAATVFLFLGYYPIVKDRFDTLPVSWAFKALLFNTSIVAVCYFQVYILGMEEILSDASRAAVILLVLFLVIGNITFFLLDRLLRILTGAH